MSTVLPATSPRMSAGNATRPRPEPNMADIGALVVRDPAMLAVAHRIEQVAASMAPVLISGESGTGKELVAAHLHRCSGHQHGPFVIVDCAALTGSLADAELYGCDPGTPLGTGSRKVTRFETARGGTLLLDEIGELDLPTQLNVLRTLRQHEVEGLGATSPARAQTRVVATTNRRMQEEVRSGRFRPDLYFRLNVIEIRLPPLRHRPADIPALAKHFALKLAASQGLPSLDVTDAAIETLMRHSWPGNVRELESVIHRAILTETGPSITPSALEIDHLEPPTVAAMGAVNTSGRTIDDVEKDMILDRLRQCRGNRALTATTLGISVRTLRNKLNDYERNGTPIPRPVIVALT